MDDLRNDLNVLSVSANRVVKANPKPDNPGGANGNKDKKPEVTLTSPTDGTEVSGTIDVTSDATDDNGVTQVEFFVDGTSIGVDTTAPYSASWDTTTSADGSVNVSATATDTIGQTSSDAVSVTVNNGGGTPPPPDSQVVPSGVARIGAAPSDNLSHDGTGVGVAIVDSGIDFAHTDIDDNVAASCFYDSSVGSSCQDDNGHGTHVAGIVAAEDNTIDVVGVAPGATVYAVKVLDSAGFGSDESVISGLDWVLLNAGSVTPPIRVVNMSLGRPKATDPADDVAIHNAVTALYDAGISLAVSAGNDPNVEAKDTVPAGFAEVMAIASTTAEDGKKGKGRCRNLQVLADTASFFTTDGKFENGVGVTVSGPGAQKEDISGCAFLISVGILSLNLGGGTTRKSGTSMSSPHVAGVLALMWDKADDAGGTLPLRTPVPRFGAVHPGLAKRRWTRCPAATRKTESVRESSMPPARLVHRKSWLNSWHVLTPREGRDEEFGYSAYPGGAPDFGRDSAGIRETPRRVAECR